MRGSATPSDFEDYFEIPGVMPGTESWRQMIDNLINEISTDLKFLLLSEEDAANIICSLLSMRELTGIGPLQEEEGS
jgi:hypothetical protein